MVAARMPAIMTPATMAASAPCVEMSAAVFTMRLSASDSDAGIAIAPVLTMPKPTMPITTATPSEMTTQTVAMRRLKLSLSSSPMAIKCSRMWGIPK